MKIARYTKERTTQIGIVVGDSVIPLAQLVPDAPYSIKELLAQMHGHSAMRTRIDTVLSQSPTGIPLSSVKLEAPIPDPQKFLAIGMNYADHVEEASKDGVTAPRTQIWFNKQVSCINGPFDAVHYPRVAEMLDYEAEVGVVIGRRCRHVSAANAQDVIGGYFVVNDVTARDWQFSSPTMTLGKSFNTHGPTGPWIVSADEIVDPHALEFRSFVNGVQRQHGHTRNMIYNIYAQIEHLSTVMTLEVGDLIATGTCAGVGLAGGEQGLLRIGDVVRVEVDGIGHIENIIIAEPR